MEAIKGSIVERCRFLPSTQSDSQNFIEVSIYPYQGLFRHFCLFKLMFHSTWKIAKPEHVCWLAVSFFGQEATLAPPAWVCINDGIWVFRPQQTSYKEVGPWTKKYLQKLSIESVHLDLCSMAFLLSRSRNTSWTIVSDDFVWFWTSRKPSPKALKSFSAPLQRFRSVENETLESLHLVWRFFVFLSKQWLAHFRSWSWK